MATSWLNRVVKTFRPLSRPARNKAHHGRFLPRVEPLDERVMPAVTATFSAAGALLRVIGDTLDNTIVVSRDAAGTILVNNGAVTIQGDKPTIANTRLIVINGGPGNDNLFLDETNGVLPAANISGDDGNDVLVGGSGDDFIDGGTGNDMAFMGAGDDTFLWNPGDGSDVVEGQGGTDRLGFNGSDAAENFTFSANGSRVRLTRDVGNVAMDLNGIESISLGSLGGADTITVDDLNATDLSQVNLDLASSAGSGDGQSDAIIVNGTNGDDLGQIAAFDDGTRIGVVVGLLPAVNITGAEATNDTLTVNALGGNDTVDASNLPANLIGLTVIGGPGNDLIQLGDGRDTFVWNPGDGSDTVDGRSGSNVMVFNGSDAAEKFDITANGSRVRFTRDVGAVTINLNGIGEIDLNALGGADSITLNDQSATDLGRLNLNLASSAGRGDGQPDAVIINGTDGADSVEIEAFENPASVGVGGLLPKVNITGADGTSDHLTVNTLGGNDVVDSSNLPADRISLTVNLGAGQVDANTRFVDQLYQDLLGHRADPAGLAFWQGQLDRGLLTRGQVAAGIESSPEYLTIVVQKAYQQFLHRAGEAAGVTGFVGFLQAGHTIEQMEAEIVGSPEYFQVRGGGVNAGFVTALYHDALGRAPDAGGLAGFTMKLATGATTGQVAAFIFGSQEFQQDLVEGFYANLLDRAADNAGLNGFVAALRHGATDQQIVEAIAGSDEFFARLR